MFGGGKAEEPPAAAAPAEPAPAAGAADAAAAAAAATAAARQAGKPAEAPKASAAEAPDAKAEAPKAAAKPKSSPKAQAAPDPAAPKAGKKDKDAKGQGKNKPKGVRLVVKNLAEDMSVEQLKTLFAPCGNVVSTNVKTKEDGKCRGFAFITFETQQEADKAIADMHEKDVAGKKLVVEIAESKVESKGADAKAMAKAGAKGDSSQKGKGKGKKGAAQQGSQAAAAHSPQEMQQMLANQQMYGAYGSNGAYTQYYAMQQQAAAAAYQQAALMQGLMMMQQQQQSWPSAAKQAGPLLQTAEYVGTVKSVSAKNGYGFIQCEDVRNDPVFSRFDYDKVARNPVLSRGKEASELKETAKTRDIYIASDILPEGGKEPGSRVKFTMGLNEKGHPQAQACWLGR